MGGGNGAVMRNAKPLTLKGPTTPPSRGPPCSEQNVWWATEYSPVYASVHGHGPEGRMTKTVNAGDGVSVKTPAGRGMVTAQLNLDHQSP